MNATKRIGVILGGLSGERDHSVRAGEVVLAALRDGGHEATPIYLDHDIDLALRQARVDVAFLALRGRYAADGCVQGLLELLGIPYTGCGVLASALAMNRARSKEMLRLHNLPTTPAYVLRAEAAERAIESHGAFGYPVVVRPVAASCTAACAVARDELELEAAVEDAFRVDDEVLVERFIEGRTVCVGVLDGVALGAVEVPGSGLAGPGRPVAAGILATGGRLSAARYRALLRLGAASYEALGCEGAACVELIVSERSNEVIVEVDTAPLLTPTAPLARVAVAAGLGYRQLLETLLEGARLRAHGHRSNRRSIQISFEGPDRRASAALAAAH